MMKQSSKNYWFYRGTDLILEVILIVWIIACLFISLIQFGHLGLQLLGPASNKIPPQINMVILKAEQWLNKFIWRTLE